MAGGTTGTPIAGGTPLSGTTYSYDRHNIMPVESWRKTMGYHPFHFWGFADTDLLKLTSACNKVVPQYSWQSRDMVSRHSIEQAIQSAESRLREYLNYSVGRRFVTETKDYPRPAHYGHQFIGAATADGRWQNVRLSEGHIRNVGVETYELISGGLAVTYSDADGDNVEETFTVTFATSVSDVDQLGLYFAEADRLDGEGVSERYRINPITIKLASGTATVKGRSWLLAPPIKYEGFAYDGSGLDPAAVANKVTTIDVYRRYADPTGTTTGTSQAMLIWESEPYPPWAVCCGSTGLTFEDGRRDPAAEAYAIGRVQVRNAKLGEVGIGRATYDADTGQWNANEWGTYRQPDRVTIRYEAGVKIDGVESPALQSVRKGDWDLIVARLACAEMPRRQFACEQANQEIYRWQFDLARASGANDEQYRISDSDLNNPLGTSAGAVYAWRQIQNFHLARAVLP